jgi:hypothetical protein
VLNNQQGSNNRAGYNDSQAGGIETILSEATIDGSSVVETFVPRVCEVKSNTTVRSWTLSGPNRTSGVNSQTLNFRRVDTTTVVTTRSWSGPRVNNATIDLNAHRVMSGNVLDLVPTNGDLSQWISDADTFIKNFNAGSMQNQVGTLNRTNAQTQADGNTTEAAIEEFLNNHRTYNQVRNGRSEETASGAEEFNVTHTPILSQKVEASHV